MPIPDESRAASRDALALQSPDALVSSLPYLVGFRPEESLVLIWIAERRLLLTQRMDLPVGQPSTDYLSVIWGHEAARAADELIVIVASGTDAHESLVEAVGQEADGRGIDVRDVLVVRGPRWRSLLCRDTLCCPAEGRLVDPGTASRIAAEFAVLGVAPRRNREEVEREVRRDEDRAAAVAPAIDEALRRIAIEDREAWRDAEADRLGDMLAQADLELLPDIALASLIVGLTDVRVRDTLLWEWVQLDADRLRDAHALLMRATRLAPAELTAPVATCGGVLAWLLGDGARALISVEHALDADGGYSLALLVRTALRAGLPPTLWRDSMWALSREDCRSPRHAA